MGQRDHCPILHVLLPADVAMGLEWWRRWGRAPCSSWTVYSGHAWSQANIWGHGWINLLKVCIQEPFHSCSQTLWFWDTRLPAERKLSQRRGNASRMGGWTGGFYGREVIEVTLRMLQVCSSTSLVNPNSFVSARSAVAHKKITSMQCSCRCQFGLTEQDVWTSIDMIYWYCRFQAWWRYAHGQAREHQLLRFQPSAGHTRRSYPK